jgi:L-ascorbate metabolism protein UlaG (beta-lactamase superfamily)
MVTVAVETIQGSIGEEFAEASPDGATTLWWLGQAGFALRVGNCRVLIDPYLSDSLAAKYAGKDFPHTRMMPTPVSTEQLPALAAVLCSHAHSDHMDPGTLPAIAAGQPACRFIVPAAEISLAAERGVPADRMLAVNVGDSVDLGGLAVHVVPAAHEELKVNAKGEHHFLGFILRGAGVSVYHSGDTIPFAGQAGLLAAHGVDVALLPVNGRDEHRTRRGVIGNMTLQEAADLCLAGGVGVLIPHHFGMFEFNTVAPQVLRRQVAGLDQRLRCLVPDVKHRFTLHP